MKTTILLLCALATSQMLNATVYTVSNNGYPAQYGTIAEGINAASDGDTLYISASGTVYNGVSLSKSLTLIGQTAFAPAGGFSVMLSSLQLNPGAEYSKIVGLNVQYYLYVYCDNVLIERCKLGYSIQMGGSGTRNGLVIRHCYLSSIALNNMSNVVIANNVFVDTNSSQMIMNSNKSTVAITNNLFIGVNAGWMSLHAISNAIVNNNIFWGAGANPYSSVTGCVFSNNITYGLNPGATDSLPFGTNIGTGNLNGVDPLFTNAPDQTFNTAYDYALQAASPGHLAGTDNTDIGIFGGSLPWPNNFGYPRLPRVTLFNITNSSIPVGGSLNVQAKARKQD